MIKILSSYVDFVAIQSNKSPNKHWPQSTWALRQPQRKYIKQIDSPKFLSKGRAGTRFLLHLSKNVAIECILVWNIETSEWASVSHPCTHGEEVVHKAGASCHPMAPSPLAPHHPPARTRPRSTPARPRVCFLNLHANSTRLLGNISCLVYTNNVQHSYKLRKGNTNASEHRPQVKHFANDHSYCNGVYLRPEFPRDILSAVRRSLHTRPYFLCKLGRSICP